MIGAVIMASGFSKRFGTNKLLAKYKDKTLIEIIVDTVTSSNISQTVIIYNDIKIKQLIPNQTLIYNSNSYKGISESIKLGCNYFENIDGIIFFPADQPLLTSATINKLIARFNREKSKIIIPQYNDHLGSPVIFPRKYYKDLLKLTGDVGGKTVINKYPHDNTFVNIENSCENFDIDTQKQYELLERMKSNE